MKCEDLFEYDEYDNILNVRPKSEFTEKNIFFKKGKIKKIKSECDCVQITLCFRFPPWIFNLTVDLHAPPRGVCTNPFVPILIPILMYVMLVRTVLSTVL